MGRKKDDKPKEYWTRSFRAKTSPKGYRKIEWALEVARVLWNDALAECIDYRRKTGGFISYKNQTESLKWIRNNMPETGLLNVHCHTFRFIFDRLQKAFARVGKGVSRFPPLQEQEPEGAVDRDVQGRLPDQARREGRKEMESSHPWI